MITIIIPARLDSTRLSKKLLAPIGDYPLLWWTWQQALKSTLAQKVIIATDSEEIQKTMQVYKAECILTNNNCNSGSDRVYQASQQLTNSEIIVNLQGDEPLMNTETIDKTIQTLLNNLECQISTPVCPFIDSTQALSNSNVKAVFNQNGKALYFSRAPLADGYLHLGLYVFRQKALEEFCALPQSRLEKAEKLEQLRALEANIPIYVYQANNLNSLQHFGVDTQEDLDKARAIILQK